MQIWLEAGREGRSFTYADPGREPIGVGDLVAVRLQGRRHIGLVQAIERCLPAHLSPERILPIEALVQAAAVEPAWRELIQAVAEDCHTSVFRTLRSALPAGWLGQRPRHSGSPRRLWEIELVAPDAPDAPQAAASAVPAPLTRRQQQLLDHLRACGGRRLLRDLQGSDRFGAPLIRGLEQRGLLRRQATSAPARAATPPAHRAAAPAIALEPARAATAAQQQAVAAIAAAAPGANLLLWGVTGAGKTEVYLQAAALELAAGRSVLLLVPEIGLVPQLLDRCRARFGAGVLEYHSGMGDPERTTAWRACLAAAARGEPQLAVGTRSAVFLPLGSLGLIVLDEEHDASYKQESPMPCYHARDVARRRCRLEGARLLLGSATPSLETWLRCRSDREGGDTQLLRLPERIGQRPLPPVRLVDMRLELAEGHRRLLSRPLQERLAQLAERREQAVVLVPRRGYHAFLSCRSCGTVVQCPHCDVALTVHRSSTASGLREWLRCHWCDHRQEIGNRCDSCGSSAFRPFGAGTQRVREQLEQELEGLRVLRFDQDTTRGRDGHRRLLERFAAGDAEVLVGTQMLAKGMDLPRVTLAVVLAADGLLHRPDLRSAETCLQLLLQLAGRAGRAELPGEVLVQTYSPEHPVLRHLVDGRYEQFLEEELALRRQAALVPFRRACLLRLAGPSAGATATAAAALAEAIRTDVMREHWSLVGPAPAAVARVAGRSRWQLLLHGPVASPLPLPSEAALRALMPRAVSLAIDPDPLQL
ncbi:MAG: primosomal protein N' [Synechococcus sp.]|nr:primosomal protein N' [Synechococcus sp.]